MAKCGFCRINCRITSPRFVGSWLDESREIEQAQKNKKKVEYISFKDFTKRDTLIDRSQLSLQDIEFKPTYELESDSVYGAVIAIPQIARSVDWNSTMVALTFRCFLLLLLNYFLQASAIMYIGEESQVMDVLAGKMHLCDFAAGLEYCPDGDHCTGPGGTKYRPDSLYGFDIWSIRIYLRDSLTNALKGTKYEELIPHVDEIFEPGDYGMESYWSRLLACFVFMLNEVQEIFKASALVMLLIKTPNAGESWVRTRNTKAGKADPLSNSRFLIAGIPISWKILYLLVVVIPKVFLLYKVCVMGVRFLMETAGIVDVILGAMTMDFILTLDELVYSALTSVATKCIMEKLESYSVQVRGTEDSMENERSGSSRILQVRVNEDSMENEHDGRSRIRWGAAKLTLPRRLILAMVALFIVTVRYYYLNCDYVDGTWVSKPMYLPDSSYYDFITLLTGNVSKEESPFWTMPGGDDL